MERPRIALSLFSQPAELARAGGQVIRDSKDHGDVDGLRHPVTVREFPKVT
jgi:hypothetical protein